MKIFIWTLFFLVSVASRATDSSYYREAELNEDMISFVHKARQYRKDFPKDLAVVSGAIYTMLLPSMLISPIVEGVFQKQSPCLRRLGLFATKSVNTSYLLAGPGFMTSLAIFDYGYDEGGGGGYWRLRWNQLLQKEALLSTKHGYIDEVISELLTTGNVESLSSFERLMREFLIHSKSHYPDFPNKTVFTEEKEKLIPFFESLQKNLMNQRSFSSRRIRKTFQESCNNLNIRNMTKEHCLGILFRSLTRRN